MQELILECLHPIVSMNFALYEKLNDLKNKSGVVEILKSYDFLFVLVCFAIAILYFFLARKFWAITFNSMFVIFIYVILKMFRVHVEPTIIEVDRLIRDFMTSKGILDSSNLPANDGTYIIGYFAVSISIVLALLLAKKLFYFVLFICGLFFGYGLFKNLNLSVYLKTESFVVEIIIVAVAIIILFYTCRWGFKNIVLFLFSFIGSTYVLTFVAALANISDAHFMFLRYLLTHSSFDREILNHLSVILILLVCAFVSFVLQRTSFLK